MLPWAGFNLVTLQWQNPWWQNLMSYLLLMIQLHWPSLSPPWFFRNLLTMVHSLSCACSSFWMFCNSIFWKLLTFLFWFLSFIGGVMFKVYIVGDAIRVVRRFSLPNVDEGDLSNNAGVFRFPRVSCAAASADDADLDPCVAGTLACPVLGPWSWRDIIPFWY